MGTSLKLLVSDFVSHISYTINIQITGYLITGTLSVEALTMRKY